MNQGQDVQDATGKGTFAANGVTPMFAKPLAKDIQAKMNMASLSPQGAGMTTKNTTEESDGEMEEQKESVQLDITDYVDALFEGQELSDEFKAKAATIFEAALNEKISIIEKAILQASEEVIQEQVNAVASTLTEQVDGYLGYVINEWMEENRLQVEQGFRTEIAENFLHGLKELFENSYVQIPEEKVDLVDELFAENRQLEENLNALMKQNMELQEKNLVNECAAAFMEMSSDLADTEVEKLSSLTESIEFGSVDQFKEKVKIIKESYFGNNAQNKQTLTEEVVSSKPLVNDDMNIYVNSISKHLKATK
jgi:hypothetical protein